MAKVIASITMSLDGFIAGPHDTVEHPLGSGVERLHDWILAGDHPSTHNDFFRLSRANRDVFDALFDATGALVVGRRTYDIVDGWNGSYPVSGIPVFVLTHEAPNEVPQGNTSFTFVSEGIEDGLSQAKRAAGDKNVQVIGGAQTIQQCIESGHCDELQIHLVPQLLGDGIRLLENVDPDGVELEQKAVISTPEVTHLHFRVLT